MGMLGPAEAAQGRVGALDPITPTVTRDCHTPPPHSQGVFRVPWASRGG